MQQSSGSGQLNHRQVPRLSSHRLDHGLGGLHCAPDVRLQYLIPSLDKNDAFLPNTWPGSSTTVIRSGKH